MSRSLQIAAALLLCSAVNANAEDAFQTFLKTNQLSNIPYIEQGKPAPGGFVVYNTQKKHALPSWFVPVSSQSELNKVIVDPDREINIPAETMKHLKDSEFELSLFGVIIYLTNQLRTSILSS